MKSLFYHTAKDSLTKLTKEEISVDADQLKAKTADETDQTQKPQTGSADGNDFQNLILLEKLILLQFSFGLFIFKSLV